MSEPFRTAQPSVSAQSDSVTAQKSDVSTSSKDTNPGLYTYKALKGVPYTVEAFKLSDFFDHPAYTDLKDQASGVDDWVQQQAKQRGLDDTTASYQEIIDEILKQIGKSDNEKPHRTFERINKAIEAQKRLTEAKLPAVLDVHSMTADEYKETRA
jgi:hypothetical protein